MRAKEFIVEGGWDSVATQGTIIKPSTVKLALKTMQKYIDDFNRFIAKKGIEGEVKIGHPTGSSAHHEVDDEDKVYGDIDLQVIAPEPEQTQGMSNAKIQSWWMNLFAEFDNTRPSYIHDDSTPGHPLVNIGSDAWVQIDIMLQTEALSTWGRFRATPERGVKGLIHGSTFSILGDLLDMSIQYNGVQLKVRDGVRMPYARTHKNVELQTVTTNIETFVLDIFKHEYQDIVGDSKPAKISPLLKQFPGTNTSDVKIKDLVNAIKGLASSFEINNMYGKGSLSRYSGPSDFIDSFIARMEEKAMKDVNSKKRNKAQTPDAVERAEADKDKVLSGLQLIKDLFNAS